MMPIRVFRGICLFFYQHKMNLLFVYYQVSDQSVLLEIGVSQMTVITYFICKNRSRDFFAMFLCLDHILLLQLETKFNSSSMTRLERSFITILVKV